MMDVIALPEDILARILCSLHITDLPLAILALRGANRHSNAWFHSNDVAWRTLEASLSSNLLSGSTAASSSSPSSTTSRRSSRLADISAERAFIKAWRALLLRAEGLHHAIACLAQDSKDVTPKKLRDAFSAWGPGRPFIDRSSPVYNATLLMEICRARGVCEATLVRCAAHLVFVQGASPAAKPPGDTPCTPLIIAASRGLPMLTSFLLACGADERPVGEGRFRLCGRAQTIKGCHSAIDWVSQLRAAEAAAGISEALSRSLDVCRNLLSAAANRRACLEETQRGSIMEPSCRPNGIKEHALEHVLISRGHKYPRAPP